MRRSLHLASSALIAALLLCAPAQAQDAPPSTGSGAAIARIEARFGALEERLRQMQGTIEEVEYENRRLREQLDIYQRDANIRFDALEQQTRDSSAPAPADATGETTAPERKQPAAIRTEQQVLKMPDKNAESFADPREHYNHAFSLLNKTLYDEAGASFESFIAAYPEDPLIGNAYYWSGETYYVRQDYVRAADYFRKGYEAMPEGPKAGDNLLKLSMSLAAMERGTEACVVLKQVAAKFGANSTTLKKKAESERTRLGCK